MRCVVVIILVRRVVIVIVVRRMVIYVCLSSSSCNVYLYEDDSNDQNIFDQRHEIKSIVINILQDYFI